MSQQPSRALSGWMVATIPCSFPPRCYTFTVSVAIVDLYWNYPRFAIPAIRLSVWFCPVARAAHMLAMVGLTALYVLATELGKKYFYSKVANANA